MTETTIAIEAGELERLRAAAESTSTKDRSPVAPQDHKPAAEEGVSAEHAGVTFTTSRKKFGSLVVLDKLEHNQIMSALRLLVGDSAVDEYLEKNPDADVEDAGRLLEALGKAVGAGN